MISRQNFTQEMLKEVLQKETQRKFRNQCLYKEYKNTREGLKKTR